MINDDYEDEDTLPGDEQQKTSGHALALLGRDILFAPIEELHPAEPITLGPQATIAQAAALMKEHHIGAILVIDPAAPNKVAGIFTERDLVMKCIAVHDL